MPPPSRRVDGDAPAHAGPGQPHLDAARALRLATAKRRRYWPPSSAPSDSRMRPCPSRSGPTRSARRSPCARPERMRSWSLAPTIVRFAASRGTSSPMREPAPPRLALAVHHAEDARARLAHLRHHVAGREAGVAGPGAGHRDERPAPSRLAPERLGGIHQGVEERVRPLEAEALGDLLLDLRALALQLADLPRVIPGRPQRALRPRGQPGDEGPHGVERRSRNTRPPPCSCRAPEPPRAGARPARTRRARAARRSRARAPPRRGCPGRTRPRRR